MYKDEWHDQHLHVIDGKDAKDEDLYVFDEDDSKGYLVIGGIWRGQEFAIIHHSSGFPDAYVRIDDEDYIDNEDDIDGNVHGGITYFGNCYWNEDDDHLWVGWDYAHYGDYTGFRDKYLNASDCHRYSIHEVMMDVAVMIASIQYGTWDRKIRKERHHLGIETKTPRNSGRYPWPSKEGKETKCNKNEEE